MAANEQVPPWLRRSVQDPGAPQRSQVPYLQPQMRQGAPGYGYQQPSPMVQGLRSPMVAPQLPSMRPEISAKKRRLLYILLSLLAVTGIVAVVAIYYFVTHYI